MSSPSGPDEIIALYAKIADAYTEQYFDDLSDVSIVNQLAAAIPASGRVLDLGCGPGNFTRHLHSHGLAAEGIDLSPAMLSIARARVPHCTFRQMDMRRLHTSDGVYDGCLAAYSLIHIPTSELPAVLREIHRVLRDGGILLVIAQEGEPDHVEDDPLAPGVEVFVNFFTQDRLARALREAGFEVESVDSRPSADPALMSQGIVWAQARKTSAVSPDPSVRTAPRSPHGPPAGRQSTPLLLNASPADLSARQASSQGGTMDGSITMYSTPWCGYCKRLKSQLTREGIAYEEVDIEQQPEAADFVMSVNGGNQTVPTVLFPDGSALTNPSVAQVKEKLAG